MEDVGKALTQRQHVARQSASGGLHQKPAIDLRSDSAAICETVSQLSYDAYPSESGGGSGGAKITETTAHICPGTQRATEPTGCKGYSCVEDY